MKTERELLELAAKAAGLDISVWASGIEDSPGPGYVLREGYLWNPLIDDGDALCLADRLLLMVDMGPLRCRVVACCDHHAIVERAYDKLDRMMVVRLCIVLCAAELAEQMG